MGFSGWAEEMEVRIRMDGCEEVSIRADGLRRVEVTGVGESWIG